MAENCVVKQGQKLLISSCQLVLKQEQNFHIIILQTLTLPLIANREAFENIVGTRENAGNQHFLLLSYNVCCPPQNKFKNFFTVSLSSHSFNFEQSKILSFGKELNLMV